MEPFENIDIKKTRNNAKRILQSFPRLCRIAGENYSLGSNWNISENPKTKHYSRNAPFEKHLEKKDSIEKRITDIIKTVEMIDDNILKIIIKKKFLSKIHEPDYVIISDLNIASSTFYKYVNAALDLFAEYYHHGELIVFKE